MKSVSVPQLERIATDRLACAWIQKAFELAAHEFGIEVWELCGSSKRREVAGARAVLVRVLRETTGLGWVAMSLILGKHHSAMIYASRHEGLAAHVRRVRMRLPAVPEILQRAAGADVTPDRATTEKLKRWVRDRDGGAAVATMRACCPNCGLDQPPRIGGGVLGMIRCANCGRSFAPFSRAD